MQLLVLRISQNPADIIAYFKAGGANKTMGLSRKFYATKVSKESKEILKAKKNLSKDPMITVMQDLVNEMYEYNKLIDDLFKNKRTHRNIP